MGHIHKRKRDCSKLNFINQLQALYANYFFSDIYTISCKNYNISLLVLKSPIYFELYIRMHWCYSVYQHTIGTSELTNRADVFIHLIYIYSYNCSMFKINIRNGSTVFPNVCLSFNLRTKKKLLNIL